MFKKVKKSSQTRSIAKKMETEAANMVAVLTPISDRREHAAAVLEAVNAGEWSAENLTLVETRITGGYAGASTPVKIGGKPSVCSRRDRSSSHHLWGGTSSTLMF
jgi:hypothetical protein